MKRRSPSIIIGILLMAGISILTSCQKESYTPKGGSSALGYGFAFDTTSVVDEISLDN